MKKWLVGIAVNLVGVALIDDIRICVGIVCIVVSYDILFG